MRSQTGPIVINMLKFKVITAAFKHKWRLPNVMQIKCSVFLFFYKNKIKKNAPTHFMLYAWPEREKGGQRINGMRKSSKQERERARRKEEWGERARNRE